MFTIRRYSFGNNIAVYPEVSVILNIVKDPALGRRGALASVATVARYESATCDEESFSSPEECALAPLGLSAPRSAACSPCENENDDADDDD